MTVSDERIDTDVISPDRDDDEEDIVLYNIAIYIMISFFVDAKIYIYIDYSSLVTNRIVHDIMISLYYFLK